MVICTVANYNLESGHMGETRKVVCEAEQNTQCFGSQYTLTTTRDAGRYYTDILDTPAHPVFWDLALEMA